MGTAAQETPVFVPPLLDSARLPNIAHAANMNNHIDAAGHSRIVSPITVIGQRDVYLVS
jgi:hypothetical protein